MEKRLDKEGKKKIAGVGVGRSKEKKITQPANRVVRVKGVVNYVQSCQNGECWGDWHPQPGARMGLREEELGGIGRN